MSLGTISNKIKSYFKDLEFNEEQHKYSLRGRDVNLTSVSHKIKDFVIPFDTLGNAERVAKREGVTTEEILKRWKNKADKACSLGTKVHLFGELYNGTQKPTNGYEEAIVKFFSIVPKHIDLLINELQMYSEEFGIAGTADLIFLNSNTNKLVIGDFKSNTDLFKNFKGQTLLKPFDNILDSPYGKYILQLSFYQLMLEQTGYEVENRFLIWLKPNGTYTCHNLPDVSKELLNELIKQKNNRKNK